MEYINMEITNGTQSMCHGLMIAASLSMLSVPALGQAEQLNTRAELSPTLEDGIFTRMDMSEKLLLTIEENPSWSRASMYVNSNASGGGSTAAAWHRHYWESEVVGRWTDVASDGQTAVFAGGGSATGEVWVRTLSDGGSGDWWELMTSRQLFPSIGSWGSDDDLNVAIKGDLLVVGNPSYDEPGLEDMGRVVVYRKTASGWILESEFSDNRTPCARFGTDVEIDDGRLIISEASPTCGGPGEVHLYVPAEDGEPSIGGGAIRGRNEFKSTVTGHDMGDFYGSKVEFEGDYIAVGAKFGSIPYELSEADVGKAYLFRRATTDNQEWDLIQTVQSEFPGIFSEFGADISIHGDMILFADRSHGAIHKVFRIEPGGDLTPVFEIIDLDHQGSISVDINQAWIARMSPSKVRLTRYDSYCGHPGAGRCASSHDSGPGCNDAECCESVCSVDPFCCEVQWDWICADQALFTCHRPTDVPEWAQVIEEGFNPTNGLNTAMKPSMVDFGECVEADEIDEWYLYIPDADGSVETILCMDSWSVDVDIVVYEGPGADWMTEIDCGTECPSPHGGHRNQFDVKKGSFYFLRLTGNQYNSQEMLELRFEAAPPQEESTPDFDGNGWVDGSDLAALLGQWGKQSPLDLDGDGIVTGADLASLLGKWGPVI
ncbi:MAG: hypothetical protein CMJ32_05520 [Phycisphaerae bacterium]|nr:hypothetical protein [Phycisphaerae bacterium]